LTFVSTAHAEEVPTIALKPPPETPSGPNAMLAVTGLVIFGVPYGFSAAAAASSNVSSDKWLYVPVIGPWGDIIARQTCGTTGCKGDMASAATPLVLSGIGQAAGVAILITTFVSPPADRGLAKPKRFNVVPTSYAGGGGVTAFGSF
jgi:hypothetical protein